jgi:hypothetical protein
LSPFSRLSSSLRSLAQDPARRRLAAWAALAMVLAIAGVLRLTLIERAMPYPQHIDEFYLSENAVRMLQTGDFNPRFFMYGGLPIYLTAAAFTVGFVDAANHLELMTTDQIGDVGFPYYEHPRVVRPARWLFALISLLGLAALAWVARQIQGGNALWLLAPALLALSDLYFEQSQLYLNVNIVGTALGWLLIAVCLKLLPRDDWPAKVLVPGLLAGTVIACKYNFGAILVVPLLAIAASRAPQRLFKAVALVAVAGGAFLCCAPYTLLDFKGFLDDLGRITYQYREGFPSNEAEPGIGHFLLYLRQIAEDLSLFSIPFALLGLGVLWRRDRLRTAMVIAFPALLLWQMSTQKAHFLRNVVPFLPLWSLLTAVGLLAASAFLALRLTAWRTNWPTRLRSALRPALLVAMVAIVAPLAHPFAWLETPLRSRQDAETWLIANAGKDETLIVAAELGLHPATLRDAGFEVEVISVRGLTPLTLLAAVGKFSKTLVLLPRFTAIHWIEKLLENGRLEAAQLNALHDELETLATFGTQEVSVLFDYPTGGDPMFVVGRPRRSPAELGDLARGHHLLLAAFRGEYIEATPWGLHILAQERVVSPEELLGPGTYRVLVNAIGTPAFGRYPVLRVRFGEQGIGSFRAETSPGEAIYDFQVATPTRAAFSLELTNDEIERDESGKVLGDRNVFVRSFYVHPLGDAPAPLPFVQDEEEAAGDREKSPSP